MELRIRSLTLKDYEEVKKIHDQYSKEFNLPNFADNFLFSFAVCDEHGNIIAAAGVRTLAEIIAVTDKRRSPRLRRTALLDVLETSSFVAESHGYKELHVFVQDEKWRDQLIYKGWRPTKGDALVREVLKDGER